MHAARRFSWSVQALALPAEAQLALYPSFVEVADELALELEETLEPFLAACGPALGSEVRSASLRTTSSR